MKKLIDICDIQYGYAYAFDSAYFTENSCYPPLARIRDVKRGYSETYYSGGYSEEYILASGDLLVGMDGEFNIARWKCDGALLNQRVCRLLAKKGTNEEYLRFAMMKVLKEIERRTAFVTVKHLSAKELNKLQLVVPDLSTQNKVAEILSRLEKIIGLRRQELKRLDDLIKARFVELFGDPIKNPKGWDVVKLSECLERIDNGKSFTCDSNAREGAFPAILKLSAATYGDYRPYENKALLDEKQFVESVEVHRGDLLFTRKNTPDLVGMAAYVFETPEKLMMPDLIFRLVTNERMTPIFLWQLINNREFRPVIQGISGGSAKSMSNISKERLKNIEIICPTISEQKKLEGVLDQVNKSKFINQLL
ncbi:restriction endonuclease subunit S [Blautia sp.]|uniref:restriction endonuclease subunit S n=1 Tax=Blautia sp. TaxID=1955243 RepID=UPI003AB11FF8